MRTLAKEKIKHWLRALLHTHDTPERTSLAFAVGVFIAFLPPVPWFHTLFALLIAFTFRLNRVATLVGTYVNTPLTFVPLFLGEISVGALMLGGRDVPDIDWRQLDSLQGWKDAALEVRPFVVPMILGCIVLGLAAAGIAYFLALRLLQAYRHRVLHVPPVTANPVVDPDGTDTQQVRGTPSARSPENPS